jgi:integrase
VKNSNTKKEYRHGLKRFSEWFGKSTEEILEMRKDDLTHRPSETLVEQRNKAARFEKEIEKFHSHLLDLGFTVNTARTLTIGIRQIFRYYEMPIRIRAGSKVAKTEKSTKNFPLTIEHVRAMFRIADFRERVILSMATDLGLRTGDFIGLKKSDLPSLEQEPPIPMDVMTEKEDVNAHCFLSQETVDVLKVYLPTLEIKNSNVYLFPSNKKSHISDEWMNRLLQRLATKVQINLNGKSLTFQCFRKMFLSAAIDSGIGLTVGQKLCGKAITKSDDTYLATVQIKEKFVQLKKFLTIVEQPKFGDYEKIKFLESAINKLQEDLSQQRIITETISEENIKIMKISRGFQEALQKKDEEIKKLKTQIEELEPIKYKVELFSKSRDELTKKTLETMNKETGRLNQDKKRRFDKRI